MHPWAADGLLRMAAGDQIIVVTWLHQGRRDTLQVRPRGNAENPLTGVFATRSPDRPNPLGLHPVMVYEIERWPDGSHRRHARCGHQARPAVARVMARVMGIWSNPAIAIGRLMTAEAEPL